VLNGNKSATEHFQVFLDSILLVSRFPGACFYSPSTFYLRIETLRAHNNHIYEHTVEVKALLLYFLHTRLCIRM